MDTQYKVALDVFEGPLDLLLYLIRKNEVDIYNIPIERVTSQYFEYIDLMRMLDLNIAGDFLVMSATLMCIKSKMLLPPEERVKEEQEEEDDPRLDLVRQLLEYKKFKDAAGYLQEKELEEERVFTRHAPRDIDIETPIGDVSIFDLIGAFNNALKRVKKDILHEVEGENFTVAEKIGEIRALLGKVHSFSLTELFGRMDRKLEVVVTFLALLELIRLKEIRAVQKNMFGEIIVEGVSC